MSIGALPSTCSRYQVSHGHHLLRSYLIERAEVVVIGKYRWSIELRFSANTTVRLLAAANPS